MNESKNAAIANIKEYSQIKTDDYKNGAPHVKHESIRALYLKLIKDVHAKAISTSRSPWLIVLGAGEGATTLPFLELDFRVTAVDSSRTQISALNEKCHFYKEKLELYCGDVFDALGEAKRQFDVIAINSFLHHVPDYISLIQLSAKMTKPSGQIFTFQDPMRYDTLSRFDSIFSMVSYITWRIFQGDVLAGTARKIRRMCGIYYEDSMHDNAEYHVTRNGVDQNLIVKTLLDAGFDCQLILYFSTQNKLFQKIGDVLGVKNSFGVMATKTIEN
jgi:ubiquinone/menaquinone biosynthesis C-methylase UbiE